MRRIVAPEPALPVERGPFPTFSVIIAAYEASKFIGAAVESALSQTRPPHEVVVCDDGSTDDLAGALRPYVDRIRLLRQENRGEGAAKNAAARAATGDFVVVLDADDRFFPERLEALGELASLRPDLDILTTDALMANDDGRVLGRYQHDQATFVTGDQRLGILSAPTSFSGWPRYGGRASSPWVASTCRSRLMRIGTSGFATSSMAHVPASWTSHSPSIAFTTGR